MHVRTDMAVAVGTEGNDSFEDHSKPDMMWSLIQTEGDTVLDY